MKTRTLFFSFLVACATLLASCAKPGESEAYSSNAEFKIVKLFEHEGVKVYRFYDNGRYIYYTNAAGATRWSETNGKVVWQRSVPTSR